MNLFDSHAHLSSPSVLPDIDGVMARAEEAGVSNMINICTDPKSFEEGLLLRDRFPQIRNAAATTPHDVEKEGEEVFPLFEKAARAREIVAVGETGLDYYYKELDVETQKRFLVRYLHLAAECNLPVIFHCREAFEDLFTIVDQEYPKGAPAILHCFTGSPKDAENVFKRGWHLSLSGIVTFKKSEELRIVAKEAPLNQLLIETDTPYLAPQSKRGKPNEPSYISETAQCIAQARGIPLEDLAKATYQNGASLFFREK